MKWWMSFTGKLLLICGVGLVAYAVDKESGWFVFAGSVLICSGFDCATARFAEKEQPKP